MVQDPQRIDLTLEPLDDYVVIQPTEDEAETKTGLIIPASAEAVCQTGIVTAVGAEPGGLEPGDKVLFPKERRLRGSAARRRGQGAPPRRADRPHPRLSPKERTGRVRSAAWIKHPPRSSMPRRPGLRTDTHIVVASAASRNHSCWVDRCTSLDRGIRRLPPRVDVLCDQAQRSGGRSPLTRAREAVNALYSADSGLSHIWTGNHPSEACPPDRSA